MNRQGSKEHIRIVVGICLRGRLRLVCAVFCSVMFFNLLELVIPKALQLLVASLSAERLSILGIDLSGVITPESRVFFFSSFLPLIALVKWGAGYVKGVLQAKLGQGALYDLRNRIFSHVQDLSFRYHDQAHSGRFVANIIEDVNEVSNFFARPFFLLFMSVTGFVCIYTYMFMISWQAGVLSISILSLTIIAFIAFVRYGYPVYQLARTSLESMVGRFSENMEGQLLVRSFGRQEEERNKFNQEAKVYHDAVVGTRILWSLLNQAFLWGVMLGVPAVLSVGIFLFQQGYGFSADNLIVLFVLQSALMLRMRVLSRIIDGWFKFNVSARRLGGLFAADDFLPDVGNILTCDNLSNSGYCALETSGDIELDKVSFAYIRNTPAIRNVSLKVKEGETVAFVGETGSGKSTLAMLICRFYDPDSGVITLGDEDIRNISLSKFRSAFALVFQDTFLFSATVRENISYGNSSACNDEIINAATLAQAHEFIMELPQGYDTIIGEKGVTLSGGQRQRLAIARAILRHPRFLVLDDATSSLDIQTELQVQESVDSLPHDITRIIIAHRFSSIENADRVFVLSDGMIVEEGTAEELRANEGSIMNRILMLRSAEGDKENG